MAKRKTDLRTLPIQTNFQKESAALPDSPAASGPSPAMLALFRPAGGLAINLEKLERRNLPPMIKPGDVPIGATFIAEIVNIVNSPVTTVKGKLLWLRPMKVENGHAVVTDGAEFTFPCTGTIRNALAPGVDGDKELQATLEKEIGKVIICRRSDNKLSKKYSRDMFMFEVWTVDKSKRID